MNGALFISGLIAYSIIGVGIFFVIRTVRRARRSAPAAPEVARAPSSSPPLPRESFPDWRKRFAGVGVGKKDVAASEELKAHCYFIDDAYRDRHIYILGKTRTGKTTLLLNLLFQDINAGKGVCFIEPAGESERLLRHIPRHREKDVIYFEPRTCPIALNPFAANDEHDIVSDGVVSAFKRILSVSDSWGPRMDSILRNAVQTLQQLPGSNLLDVHKLLVNEDFRTSAVARVPPQIAEYWTERFEHLPPNATEPLLDRLDRITTSPILSRIFGNSNGLDIADVMDSRKILIVNLGKVAYETQTLLGSVIAAMVQQTAFRRASLPEDERVPFYLFVDEFQDFAGSTFSKILSQAGKFKLCLTIAHQFISQLDDLTRESILGNVGTIISFALGPRDAKYLAAEFHREHDPRLVMMANALKEVGRYGQAARILEDFDPSKLDLDSREIIFKGHHVAVLVAVLVPEDQTIADVRRTFGVERIKTLEEIEAISDPTQFLTPRFVAQPPPRAQPAADDRVEESPPPET